MLNYPKLHHIYLISAFLYTLIIIIIIIIDRFYIALFSALERTHCARMLLYISDHFFKFCYSAFLNIHRSGVLTALTWLVPRETAAVSVQVLCTPYNRVPCHFVQSRTRNLPPALLAE